ncbi:hypothetical protein F5X68DRAFT_193261 [Plectosphaerella plurivora]|uniref:Uncharacterized protein n=1 Tax=Plectosphaerella plurivora TaxID=936078 RepID=A0A9P8V6B0_9PEZI|nr:hypothetical protein F5X68DRAFT_193261 [Plectosphaerella plurivora]
MEEHIKVEAVDDTPVYSKTALWMDLYLNNATITTNPSENDKEGEDEEDIDNAAAAAAAAAAADDDDDDKDLADIIDDSIIGGTDPHDLGYGSIEIGNGDDDDNWIEDMEILCHKLTVCDIGDGDNDGSKKRKRLVERKNRSFWEFARRLKVFMSSTEPQWILDRFKYPLILETIQLVKQDEQASQTGNIGRTKGNPGRRLVVLDIEWSPGSRQVWEVAAIDFFTGDTIINCLVKHEKIKHAKDRDTPLSLQHWSHDNAEKIYSEKRGMAQMTPEEIADRLEAAGINKQTIVIVYATNATDLVLVRKLLATIDRHHFLPEKANCVPVTHSVRPNIRPHVGNGDKFSLRLEDHFPLVCLDHELIGLNHQALVDCKQLPFVVIAMNDLALPPEQRQMDWENIRAQMTAAIDKIREEEEEAIPGSKRERGNGDDGESAANKRKKSRGE